MDKISLRDLIACHALQGMIAADKDLKVIQTNIGACYEMADAMLKERENHKHEWESLAPSHYKKCKLCNKIEEVK